MWICINRYVCFLDVAPWCVLGVQELLKRGIMKTERDVADPERVTGLGYEPSRKHEVSVSSASQESGGDPDAGAGKLRRVVRLSTSALSSLPSFLHLQPPGVFLSLMLGGPCVRACVQLGPSMPASGPPSGVGLSADEASRLQRKEEKRAKKQAKKEKKRLKKMKKEEKRRQKKELGRLGSTENGSGREEDKPRRRRRHDSESPKRKESEAPSPPPKRPRQRHDSVSSDEGEAGRSQRVAHQHVGRRRRSRSASRDRIRHPRRHSPRERTGDRPSRR